MTRHRHLVVGSLATLTMLFAACGGTSSGGGSVTPTVGGAITIDNESGSSWSCVFNPFNGSVNFLAMGIIYEPLVYDNLLNDKKTPWLASAYQWSPDNKTLTFTIRPNVQWSDGQPFTAADVVYTFNLIKQNSALDLQSVWTVLSSVAPVGSDQVVMTFQSSAVPYFYQIADQTSIVPQHIWSTIKDPVNELDKNPVGTGPYTMSQCTSGNIQYTRNPNYWQKGLPYIQTVNYPSFLTNDPANALLAAGQAQWGGQFIPNIDTYYVARDPAHNKYWFPPIQNIDLWLNVKDPPLDNKLVRQAIAYGIDRPKVSKIGEYGYEPAGNQTGVIEPTFSSWVDNAQAAKYDYKFDTNKATQLLTQAGYTMNSAGIMQDSSGHKLSFKVINIGGYTDWVASLQVVQANLKQIGVDIQVVNQSSTDYFNNLFTGNFQLAYGSLSASPGPTPYYELRNTLHSATTAAIGQTAAGDYGRYSNPAVDALLDQFGATTDPAQQHKLMSQVEAIMLEDVPVIPVTEGVAWYEWTTKGFAGWPTPADQYAAPAPWNLPDWEVVLLHLYKTPG
jgi:peptide/nickel transport system substrate-binding protein